MLRRTVWFYHINGKHAGSVFFNPGSNPGPTAYDNSRHAISKFQSIAPCMDSAPLYLDLVTWSLCDLPDRAVCHHVCLITVIYHICGRFLSVQVHNFNVKRVTAVNLVTETVEGLDGESGGFVSFTRFKTGSITKASGQEGLMMTWKGLLWMC